jgi:hypothetical protein
MSGRSGTGETTVQMLGRLLDEALEALAGLQDHVTTRSGYCAKCEGGCLQNMSTSVPVPFVAHPWDAVVEREQNVEAARTFGRAQRWMATVSERQQ